MNTIIITSRHATLMRVLRRAQIITADDADSVPAGLIRLLDTLGNTITIAFGRSVLNELLGRDNVHANKRHRRARDDRTRRA